MTHPSALSGSPVPPVQAAPNPSRLHGIIVRVHEKGFGFVAAEGEEFFIHATELPAAHWRRGQTISFVPAEPRKGSRSRRATQVIVTHPRAAMEGGS